MVVVYFSTLHTANNCFCSDWLKSQQYGREVLRIFIAWFNLCILSPRYITFTVWSRLSCGFSHGLELQFMVRLGLGLELGLGIGLRLQIGQE